MKMSYHRTSDQFAHRPRFCDRFQPDSLIGETIADQTALFNSDLYISLSDSLLISLLRTLIDNRDPR